MAVRTTKSTVTFASSFTLADMGEVLPAGTYDVETDEELLEGVSFEAYRRVQTLIHLPVKSGNPDISRTLMIDPNVLDDALERDNAPSPSSQKSISA